MKLQYQKTNFSNVTFTIDGKSVEVSGENFRELLNFLGDIWRESSSGGFYADMINRYWAYDEVKASVQFDEQEETHSDNIAIREKLLKKRAAGGRVPETVDKPIPDFSYRVTEDMRFFMDAEDNNKAQEKIKKAYEKKYGVSTLEFDSESSQFNAYTKSRTEALQLELFLYNKYIKKEIERWVNGKPVVIDDEVDSSFLVDGGEY